MEVAVIWFLISLLWCISFLKPIQGFLLSIFSLFFLKEKPRFQKKCVLLFFTRVCAGRHFSCVRLFVMLWPVGHEASLSVGLLQARILECCHVLLQRIFPTQRSNPCLLISCIGRQVLYHQCHMEMAVNFQRPRPFSRIRNSMEVVVTRFLNFTSMVYFTSEAKGFLLRIFSIFFLKGRPWFQT